MIQSVPYRTYALPSAPEDYVGRRIRNDEPFVCKTLVTMGKRDGPVCRYIFPCHREGLRCELGNVPSPFDKLRAGSPGLVYYPYPYPALPCRAKEPA